MLTRRSGPVTTSFVKDIADLSGFRWDDGLASIPDIVDSAIQSGRAIPFVVADLITAISAVRPDAEVLALGLAEAVLAHRGGHTAVRASESFEAVRELSGRTSFRMVGL
jgi:hypothetical protein